MENKPEPTIGKAFAFLSLLFGGCLCLGVTVWSFYWPISAWFSGYISATVWSLFYWRGFEAAVWLEQAFEGLGEPTVRGSITATSEMTHPHLPPVPPFKLTPTNTSSLPTNDRGSLSKSYTGPK